MLRATHLGLEDMRGDNHNRHVFGFFALVVFGRSMTLVMQHLRTYDKSAFDEWYAPWLSEMSGDPLLKWFYALRTQIVHDPGPLIGTLLSATGIGDLPPIGSLSIDGVRLPTEHLGEPIADTSTLNLCELYLRYLRRVFESFAPMAFEVQDRYTAGHPWPETGRVTQRP
jgi:hypothetical protein